MHNYLVTAPCFMNGKLHKVGDKVKSEVELTASYLTEQIVKVEKPKRKAKKED